MIIFWRLVFAHFLADFTLQSNFINDWKRSSQAGMFVHCMTHPVVSAIAIYPYLFDVWLKPLGIPINGLAAICFITIFHYLEDILRVHTIKKYNVPDSTLYFLWDQFAHLCIIFIFFGVRPDGDFQEIIPELWPIIGVLAVAATHFSVVLFYFIEKDFYDRSYPSGPEKYTAIIERAIAFASVLLVPDLRAATALMIVGLLVPRIAAVHFKAPVSMPPNLAWAGGAFIAIAAGVLGRILL
ncbi:MAG: DUF3307 domain-containing protein [Elusimicrobia bacterium]|nr:DUF3307 domain-containing protein [Elusimicrobiota bacterium]